ncbi:MAG: TIM barrel protein [Planctomycetes bacterium]|nr:TIM barrel protein [Planctomycetota bacterium]
MPKKRVKNSVGIWGFSPLATRFMPAGYQTASVNESMEDRTKRAVDGLGPLVDGYEFHYPGEVNEDNLAGLQKVLGKDHDIYAIAMGLHCMPELGLGGFTSPKKELRDKTVDTVKRALDICKDIGAKLIIWPGGEGYNYPFQVSYNQIWDHLIEGIQKCVEYANTKNVTVLLEHKNSEPAMKILMRNIGMTIFVINKLKEMGTDTTNLKVNMDWQHLIMNGEHLAEYAALLDKENLLGHHHGNSGWGLFDDDNIVGALNFMETLGLCIELRRMNYGRNGERIGFDLFPYTENQVDAVKRSVLHWEFMESLVDKIDLTALNKVQQKKDAIGCYKLVYGALGLDKKFEEQVYKKYSSK